MPHPKGPPSFRGLLEGETVKDLHPSGQPRRAFGEGPPVPTGPTGAEKILGQLPISLADLPPALPTTLEGLQGFGAGQALPGGFSGAQGLFGSQFQNQLAFMQSPQPSLGNINFTIPNIKSGSKRGRNIGGKNGKIIT